MMIEDGNPLDSPMTEEEAAAVGGPFPKTRWTLVLEVQGKDTAAGKKALEELCRMYWHPVYVFVRKNGRNAEEAEDLTQEFFRNFVKRRSFEAADRNRGRLRSYLLTSVKNILANDYRRHTTAKRGGGEPLISLDTASAEERYAAQPAHQPLTPVECYERRWALTLMENALEQLRLEYHASGKGTVFDNLEVYLAGGAGYGSYGEVAQRLGMKETAVQVAVHRLRRRYRQCMHEQIAHTVAAPEDVEDELRHVFRVFAK